MTDGSTAIFLVVVGAVAAGALLWIFRRRRRIVLQEDHYTKGLELWLAGELQGAIASLRLAIEAEPASVDPYLQLGNLLRAAGDARRAAVLHRTLTVRGDVPEQKRMSIALALADDLIELKQWEEARQVLDELETIASGSTRFWRSRFRQWFGLGDEAAAARALREGAKKTDPAQRARFQADFELFQLDRALRAVRDGHPAEARQLLRGVQARGPWEGRLNFVRALVAAREGDFAEATEIMTAGLVAHPEEMRLFLPALQDVLLESGHFERTIPIMEAACQSEAAPPALWINLALLYEKLGERAKAIELLAEKAGDPNLTPDVAAPFLRLLAAARPDADFARVWRFLRMPSASRAWRCRACGAKQPDVLWVCPSCQALDTIGLSPR
mgnify:CR=1 FL=1